MPSASVSKASVDTGRLEHAARTALKSLPPLNGSCRPSALFTEMSGRDQSFNRAEDEAAGTAAARALNAPRADIGALDARPRSTSSADS